MLAFKFTKTLIESLFLRKMMSYYCVQKRSLVTIIFNTLKRYIDNLLNATYI